MKTNPTTDMTTAFPYNHAKRRYSNTAPRVTIAYAYYRLSQEEANEGQSSSILNQEKIVRDYCAKMALHFLIPLSMTAGLAAISSVQAFRQ